MAVQSGSVRAQQSTSQAGNSSRQFNWNPLELDSIESGMESIYTYFEFVPFAPVSNQWIQSVNAWCERVNRTIDILIVHVDWPLVWSCNNWIESFRAHSRIPQKLVNLDWVVVPTPRCRPLTRLGESSELAYISNTATAITINNQRRMDGYGWIGQIHPEPMRQYSILSSHSTALHWGVS